MISDDRPRISGVREIPHVKVAVEQMCDQAQNQFTDDQRPVRLMLVSADGHFSNSFTLEVERRLRLNIAHVSSLRAAAVMLEAGRKVDLILVDAHIQSDVVTQLALFLVDYSVMAVLLIDETKAPLHFTRLAVVNRDDTAGALSAIVYALTVGL